MCCHISLAIGPEPTLTTSYLVSVILGCSWLLLASVAPSCVSFVCHLCVTHLLLCPSNITTSAFFSLLLVSCSSCHCWPCCCRCCDPCPHCCCHYHWPQHKVLSARADPTGKPCEITFRCCQEIIDCSQTHTAPQNFTPKFLYDGKAIIFASHNLGITGGAITLVPVCLPSVQLITYSTCAVANRCPDEQPTPGTKHFHLET